MLDVIRDDKKLTIVSYNTINNIDELIDALWWNDVYIRDNVYIDTNQSRAYYHTLDYATTLAELENLKLSLNNHNIVTLQEIDYNDWYDTCSKDSLLDWVISRRLK